MRIDANPRLKITEVPVSKLIGKRANAVNAATKAIIGRVFMTISEELS